MSRADSGLFEESTQASPRPWYFDGRDIFSVRFGEGGHRLVIPLPDPTWHSSQRVSEVDARLVVQAVNEYEALRHLEKCWRAMLADELVEIAAVRDHLKALDASRVQNGHTRSDTE